MDQLESKNVGAKSAYFIIKKLICSSKALFRTYYSKFLELRILILYVYLQTTDDLEIASENFLAIIKNSTWANTIKSTSQKKTNKKNLKILSPTPKIKKT